MYIIVFTKIKKQSFMLIGITLIVIYSVTEITEKRQKLSQNWSAKWMAEQKRQHKMKNPN